MKSGIRRVALISSFPQDEDTNVIRYSRYYALYPLYIFVAIHSIVHRVAAILEVAAAMAAVGSRYEKYVHVVLQC